MPFKQYLPANLLQRGVMSLVSGFKKLFKFTFSHSNNAGLTVKVVVISHWENKLVTYYGYKKKYRSGNYGILRSRQNRSYWFS